MTRGPITNVFVDLDSVTPTNRAIGRLYQNYETINSFAFFKTQINSDDDNGAAEKLSTQNNNFTNFLGALTNIANYNGGGFPHEEREFAFYGEFVLSEAKALTRLIQKLGLTNATFRFSNRTAERAFSHLINHYVATKAVNNNDKFNHQGQEKNTLKIEGKAIEYCHTKCLTKAIKSSSFCYLKLSETNIGDKGISVLVNALCQNTAITELHLPENKIRIFGAQALAKLLRKNSSLQLLNLASNKFGDDGVAAIAKSLCHNSTLQELDLTQAGCKNKGLLALAEGLSKNTGLKKLDLSRNRPNRNCIQGMKALGQSLKQNSTLTQLDMVYIVTLHSTNSFLIGAFLNAMDGKSSKLNLNLASNESQVTQDATNMLVKCNMPLVTLTLGLGMQSSHVETLIGGIRELTFNMQSLSLQWAEIDDNCIRYLFDTLVQVKDSCALTELSLRMIDGMTQAGAQHIVDKLPLTNLENLDLGGIPIGNNGVQRIASYLNNTKLTKLGLTLVGMEDSGLIALSDTLKSNNSKLTHLDIFNNSAITTLGEQALLESLREGNNSLIHIRVGKVEQEETTTFEKQIKFYMELNKLRQKLYGQQNNLVLDLNQLFPFIVDKYCTKQPSFVYWTLRNSPQLFLVNNQNVNNNNKQKEDDDKVKGKNNSITKNNDDENDNDLERPTKRIKYTL